MDIVGGDPPQTVVQHLLAESGLQIAHGAFGGAALAGAEGDYPQASAAVAYAFDVYCLNLYQYVRNAAPAARQPPPHH